MANSLQLIRKRLVSVCFTQTPAVLLPPTCGTACRCDSLRPLEGALGSYLCVFSRAGFCEWTLWLTDKQLLSCENLFFFSPWKLMDDS